MMEAARSSEMLVNFYQTARRYNPEDSHLRTHRRENLKFKNECDAIAIRSSSMFTFGDELGIWCFSSIWQT
jgi:hypothetical protein